MNDDDEQKRFKIENRAIIKLRWWDEKIPVWVKLPIIDIIDQGAFSFVLSAAVFSFERIE